MDRGSSGAFGSPESRVINNSEPLPKKKDQASTQVQDSEDNKASSAQVSSLSSQSTPSFSSSRGNYRGSSSSLGDKKNDTNKSKRWLISIVIALALIIIAGAVWLFLMPRTTTSNVPPIDTSKYQAVSLTDGQLYFGKLTAENGDYFKLTDVYYLQQQNSTDTSQSETNQSSFKLLKFTDLIYGPEDGIVIPKSQVLFYDNLQDGGRVSQLISQQKTK